MQKILSLSSKDFYTGIANGLQSDRSGLFYSAPGINPFIGLRTNNNYDMGLLQTYASPVSIGTINGNAKAIAHKVTGSSAMKMWTMTDTGHFYETDQNLNSATDKRSATPITGPACGMFLFQSPGGSEYLYYIQQTQIGQWDMTGTYATGWNDSWATGLQSTIYHYPHRFGDRVYITDKDRISYVYDNSGTPTLSLNALDFEANERAMAINDDGTYLVVGLTRNLGDDSLRGQCRVVFWDTISSSWNREWPIKASTITGIANVDGVLHAVTPEGIFAFNYSTPPKLIKPFKPATSYSSSYDNGGSVTTLENAVIWGGSTGAINSLGKLSPDAPNALLQIAPATTYRPFIIKSDIIYTHLIVGDSNGGFYKYPLTTGGATGSAQTIAIDLKDQYQIKRIDLVFGRPLASGDAFDVDVQGHISDTVKDWNAVSFATDGAIISKKLESSVSLITDQLIMTFNWTGGNVRIKRIDVHGEPTSR